MRKLLQLLVVASTVIAIGLAAANALAASGARPAASAGIAVKDDFFSPSSKTVAKGATVKWTWRGSDPHNVTVTKGPVKFASPTKSKGTYSKALNKAGTYRIVCTIHDMTMTLKVKQP